MICMICMNCVVSIISVILKKNVRSIQFSIESKGVLAVMEDRLDVAVNKSCDGIVPDNVEVRRATGDEARRRGGWGVGDEWERGGRRCTDVMHGPDVCRVSSLLR